jgi:site-specific recombinase XerD
LNAGGWTLNFYDREFADVEDLVGGLGDVAVWAKRNGARAGTPFFLDPTGRADPLVNAFWRDPIIRSRSVATQRRYASSLKVWLDFLDAVGARWDEASRSELAAFKEWRMASEENERRVTANCFRIDQAAIRGFYLWAAEQHGVANPVGARIIGASRFGDQHIKLDSTPTGARVSAVKWLTPKAFRLWRDVGLRGYTTDGALSPDWKGLNEDRDVAFVEGLFGTGLRIGEMASLLTIELPNPSQDGLVRGYVADSCAKRGYGRPFWIRRRVAQLIRYYAEEAGRPASVLQAQRAGTYDSIKDRWIVEKIEDNHVLVIRDATGSCRKASLNSLSPSRRMKLFRNTHSGVEPLWLWLNDDGRPRPKQAWYKTFDRANRRVKCAMEKADLAPLWCRPHMLRHSFALRWYCIATFVAWQRTDLLTREQQRDFRNQLGDVWFLMATLLGHRSAETTRSVYLEPFQALQVEQLVALMDSDDRDALERLVSTLVNGQPQVLKAPNDF